MDINKSTRFVSAVSSFNPEGLLRELHKYLLFSLIVALGIHLAAAIIDPADEVVKSTPRPLTTKFIKREPR